MTRQAPVIASAATQSRPAITFDDGQTLRIAASLRSAQ